MASQFGDFTASELYCPKCARAQRVRERLLLILPNGELYEYLCSGCGTSLGQRQTTGPGSAFSIPTRAPARRPAPNPGPRGPAPRRPRGLLS
jgi:hypothetical protein